MGFWKDRKGYRVYCGIDDAGKPIRKHVSTIEEAKHLLATYRLKKGRYDADLLALSEKAKIEVYTVLLKCTELGVSLSELLDFYCVQNNKVLNSKTCQECADLYLENMKTANRRAISIAGMRRFLQRFFFKDTPIKALTFQDVKDMFDQHPVRSRRNWKIYCSAFLNFCVKAGYCEHNFASELVLPSVDKNRPDILTLEQIKTLLSKAECKLLTFIVISLFCGLRPTEYKRLKKENVNLDTKLITIESDMAKTRAFRIVKIPPVALAWLKKFGIHLIKSEHARPVREARVILGLKTWGQDILRHTSASYMITRDLSADAVALQLGNSPDILHRHYKNLVTDAEAEEFWNLTPDAIGRDY